MYMQESITAGPKFDRKEKKAGSQETNDHTKELGQEGRGSTLVPFHQGTRKGNTLVPLL